MQPKKIRAHRLPTPDPFVRGPAKTLQKSCVPFQLRKLTIDMKSAEDNCFIQFQDLHFGYSTLIEFRYLWSAECISLQQNLIKLYAPVSQRSFGIPWNIPRKIPWNMKMSKVEYSKKICNNKNIYFLEYGIFLEYSKKRYTMEM